MVIAYKQDYLKGNENHHNTCHYHFQLFSYGKQQKNGKEQADTNHDVYHIKNPIVGVLYMVSRP
jgi:hypothetical protein